MTKIDGKTFVCSCNADESTLIYIKEHKEAVMNITSLDKYPCGSIIHVLVHRTVFQCSYCQKCFTVEELKEYMANMK